MSLKSLYGSRGNLGSVGNADRKCKAKTNFAACGQNLGEYTAMHFASGVFAGVFLRVRRKNRTYRAWGLYKFIIL